MKKTSILLICFIALVAFCIWAPNSFAEPQYFNSTPGQSLSCSVCHSSAPVTCAGCHFHGASNIKATTDQPTYSPGDPVTVSISGGNESGWVRTILYDPNGNELARSSGPSGLGNGPGFPGPIDLTSPAPSVPGIYTWFASWYGHSFRNGANSNNFVPDILNAGHGEVTVSTNSFEVVAQCDTNAPTVTAPADMTITLPPGNTGPVPVSDPGILNFLNSAAAMDPEDGNLPVTDNAPADFPIGTTPVTFFATDSCGNKGSATANVIIEVANNSLPVVTAPVPIDVTAPLCTTSVTATDQAIAAFLNSATSLDAEDGDVTASIKNDAPVDFPVGTVTTVTFTATDSLGANGTATATVTVIETLNSAPAVTAPAAIIIMVPSGTPSVSATDPAIAAFLNSATATDAEDGDVTASITNDALVDFPVGTTQVTFSVTDSCGVPANGASTVTIQEENGNVAPVLNVPDQITVDAQVCAISVPNTNPAIDAFLKGATATDAEDGDVTASITNDAPADFPIGTTKVTFSVTDSSGGATTGVASVIIVDTNTAPVVIGPTPLPITVDAGTTSVPATDTAIAAFLNNATATDIEDGDVTASITNNAPADFPMGVTTVTFSAKDSCGLTATADSTVTITENLTTVVDPPSDKKIDDDIDDDEHEADGDIDDDEHENKYQRYKKYFEEKIHHWKKKHNWKKKYERENKYHYEDQPSSRKLRLLKEDDDD